MEEVHKQASTVEQAVFQHAVFGSDGEERLRK
jgi:hypothetical protein